MANHPENGITHRELETDADHPGVQVASVVADIEGKEPTDLTKMHDCVDGVLTDLFSNPPSPNAQMLIKFSYEGYRITVEQDGDAKFSKIG